MKIEELVCEIAQSKNYRDVCPATIERIVAGEIPKYKSASDVLKSAKTKLHQITQSFFGSAQKKSAQKYFDAYTRTSNETEKINILNNICTLHSSTKERLAFAAQFYEDIFSHLPPIQTLADIACGLNPILLTQFAKNKNISISAYDIDLGSIEILNQFFSTISPQNTAEGRDILQDIPNGKFDVVLLFKILPLLEQQQKGYYKTLLTTLDTKHFVITFPTKTLGGKSIGMQNFYSTNFEEFLKTSPHKIVFKKEYQNELLYIIAK